MRRATSHQGRKTTLSGVSSLAPTLTPMPIFVPSRAVQASAELFELSPAGLDPLPRQGAPDGAVYRCRQRGRDAFLKLKPISAEALPAERDRVEVVRYLGGHVRVPEYLVSTAGSPLEVVSSGTDHYAVTLTACASGRHVDFPRDWTPGFIGSWATTLGTMHAALRRYDGGRNLPDWRDEHGSFMVGCRDDAVGRVWIELGEAMATLPTGVDHYGIVHNDLHAQNLLIDTSGELTVLDFDVTSRHWFLTDLAILLAHPLWDLRGRDPGGMTPFVETALAAYTAVFPTDRTALAALPLLMRYRMALFVLAMSNELGEAPPPPWLEGIRSWVLSDEPLMPGLDRVIS